MIDPAIVQSTEDFIGEQDLEPEKMSDFIIDFRDFLNVNTAHLSAQDVVNLGVEINDYMDNHDVSETVKAVVNNEIRSEFINKSKREVLVTEDITKKKIKPTKTGFSVKDVNLISNSGRNSLIKLVGEINEELREIIASGWAEYEDEAFDFVSEDKMNELKRAGRKLKKRVVSHPLFTKDDDDDEPVRLNIDYDDPEDILEVISLIMRNKIISESGRPVNVVDMGAKHFIRTLGKRGIQQNPEKKDKSREDIKKALDNADSVRHGAVSFSKEDGIITCTIEVKNVSDKVISDLAEDILQDEGTIYTGGEKLIDFSPETPVEFMINTLSDLVADAEDSEEDNIEFQIKHKELLGGAYHVGFLKRLSKLHK